MKFDPDELFEMVKNLLQKFGIGFDVSGPGLRGKEGSSSNPEDYPRKIQVKDGDLLMLIEEVKQKRLRSDRLTDDLKISWHDHEHSKARLFKELDTKYPHIRTYGAAGQGWRSWKGDYWYVGYNHEDAEGGENEETKDK